MLRKLHDLHRKYRGKRVEIKEKLSKILFDKKNKREEEFDLNKLNRILFLRYDDKIGDMVVTTMMFREIKKKYPNCKIDIVLKTKSDCIIDENPYIGNIYRYKKNILKDYKLSRVLKKNNYDLVFSFVEKMRGKEMFFIKNISAKAYIGVNRKDYKYFKYSVNQYLNEHITMRYKKMLEFIKIDDISDKYELYLNKESEKKVESFFSNYSEINQKKIICINPYGASKYRQIRMDKLEEIVSVILKKIDNVNLTFIFPPNKKLELEYFVNKLNDKRVSLFQGIETIKDSISIINKSDLIISPDTSIVHIASALEKNQIAIYEQDYYQNKQSDNFMTWHPNSKRASVLFSRKKETLEDRVYADEIDLEELMSLIKNKIF